MDFMFAHSSTKELSRSELTGLSLAELRIARNEIFARHGRQFWDPYLNKWFYSKQWYLAIMVKYSPDDFDRMPSPLTDLERTNIRLIREFENNIRDNEWIFPNSSTQRLTEYDVMLSKPILEKALGQIYTMAGVEFGEKGRLNTIELYNVELVEYALAQELIDYD
jgi:N6-adenosine-specific RNA methylase IME4